MIIPTRVPCSFEGAELGDPVLTAEGRVTLIDALLSGLVLLGLVLNAALGWWRG